jgi:hypothetical protein
MYYSPNINTEHSKKGLQQNKKKIINLLPDKKIKKNNAWLKN